MAIYRDLNHTTPKRTNNLNDLDALYQAAVTLLTARKRTKPFEPEYGGNLEDYLYEPCDEDTAAKIKYEINTLFSQDSRFEFNYSRSTIIPDPINQQFLLNLILVFPALGSTEYSLNMVLNNIKDGN